jgi:hypothetical protein
MLGQGRRLMTMSLEAAAQVMRDAMRETIRRHSLWYLVHGRSWRRHRRHNHSVDVSAAHSVITSGHVAKSGFGFGSSRGWLMRASSYRGVFLVCSLRIERRKGARRPPGADRLGPAGAGRTVCASRGYGSSPCPKDKSSSTGAPLQFCRQGTESFVGLDHARLRKTSGAERFR